MHRIAFYIPTLREGGIERNVVMLANEIARRDIPCMVVLHDASGPNRDLLSDKVEVAVMPKQKPLPLSPLLAFPLRKILADWQASVVFARDGYCSLVADVAQYLRRGVRAINSFHNPRMPNAWRNERKRWLMMPLLGRMAYHTIAVSREIERDLIQHGVPAGKCSTINNPVDLPWIETARTQPSSLPLVNGETGVRKPYILTIGRLAPQKGYPNLIDAFAMIADEIDMDLIIVGEGPDFESLYEQVKQRGMVNRVIFPGYVKNPFPLYENAAMFVSSSHFEGFPTVLIEALAFGLPIIANNGAGGSKEVLDGGKYGTLVPDGDVGALANAMKMVHARKQTDEEKSAIIARACEFSVERIVDQYLALLGWKRT